jgi:hypothetical protein
MPTKNPRLTITLTPALGAQLRKLSELTGNSQSALISDLLEGSGDVFDRVIAVLSAAKEAQLSIKGKLASDMDDAQKKLEGQLGLALDTFEQGTRPLLDEVETIKRRSRRQGPASGGATQAGAAGPKFLLEHFGTPMGGHRGETPNRAVSTPLSNRGVRSANKTTKVHKRGN